jgi:uncharacterized protein (DUF302 family)
MEIVKKLLLIAAFGMALFANDIIIKTSHCGVDKTVNKIRNIVTKKSLHIFAVINHSGNAKMVNMKLNKSKMIIFGNEWAHRTR